MQKKAEFFFSNLQNTQKMYAKKQKIIFLKNMQKKRGVYEIRI